MPPAAHPPHATCPTLPPPRRSAAAALRPAAQALSSALLAAAVVLSPGAAVADEVAAAAAPGSKAPTETVYFGNGCFWWVALVSQVKLQPTPQTAVALNGARAFREQRPLRPPASSSSPHPPGRAFAAARRPLSPAIRFRNRRGRQKDFVDTEKALGRTSPTQISSLVGYAGGVKVGVYVCEGGMQQALREQRWQGFLSATGGGG